MLDAARCALRFETVDGILQLPMGNGQNGRGWRIPFYHPFGWVLCSSNRLFSKRSCLFVRVHYTVPTIGLSRDGSFHARFSNHPFSPSLHSVWLFTEFSNPTSASYCFRTIVSTNQVADILLSFDFLQARADGSSATVCIRTSGRRSQLLRWVAHGWIHCLA